MPLINWPPSKGPKPAWLRSKRRYIVPNPERHDFRVKQTADTAAERRILLDAVMDFHPIDDKDVKKIPDVEDKVGHSFRMEKEGKRVRRRKGETKFLFNHHIATLGTLTITQAIRLIQGYGVTKRGLEHELPLMPINVQLTYPLSKGVELTIHPYQVVRTFGNGKIEEDERMEVGYLLWVIAQEYFRIYKNWKQYKVWGHDIGDLFFEGLKISKNGDADLLVGSP